MKRRNFINIQLFGEGEGDGNPQPPTPPVEPTKTVSKDLYDKTSSELADAKKRIKELESAGKTEQQRKDDEIAEKEQAILQKEKELAEKQVLLNKANIVKELAEVKATIGLDENVAKIDDFVDFILDDDETKSVENAKNFAKLLKEVYNKGANDNSNDRFFGGAKKTPAKNGDKESEYAIYKKTQTTNKRVEL